MVVEDMRNTGVLGNPEEYFIPWEPSKEGIDWFAQLEGIVKKASSSNGIVSIKVMSNQLNKIDQCLKQSWPNELEVDINGLYPYFRAVTKHAKFMFIRRDNILRQAISRGISRQTGINHATGSSTDEHFAGNLLKGYSTDYNNSVKYDNELIKKDIMAIVDENMVWERFFSDWGVKRPLVLRYEEVCMNSPGYLTRVMKFVGVSSDELNFERKMVALSNNKNEQWYNQYFDSYVSSL
jgi:LPS sulfotransferase NodH